MKTQIALCIFILCLVLCSGCTTHSIPESNGGNESGIENRMAEQTLPVNVSNPADLLIKADFLLKEGNFTGADQMYQSLIHANSTDPKVWFNHGVALLEKQKYPEAIESFEKADKLGLDDKDPYWYNKGIINLGFGHHEEADRYFRMVDKNDALYPQSLILCSVAKKISNHFDGTNEMAMAQEFNQTRKMASENLELFNLTENVQFSMPTLVACSTVTLNRVGNEKIITELQDLVSEYYKKHEYSKKDLFVCSDMALDLWGSM